MVGVGNVIHRNRITHTEGTGRNGYQDPDNVLDLNVYITPEPYGGYFDVPWHEFQAAGYEAQGDLFGMDPIPAPRAHLHPTDGRLALPAERRDPPL
jgi:hypothetical protein